MLKPESIDDAIKGCDYVVHKGSPFPLAVPDDENVLIKPAVEGKLAAVRAAHKHKVKRVVITSSWASINVQKPDYQKDHLVENDWSDASLAGPYEKSKTLAEKAAWDSFKASPNKRDLPISKPSRLMKPKTRDLS